MSWGGGRENGKEGERGTLVLESINLSNTHDKDP